MSVRLTSKKAYKQVNKNKLYNKILECIRDIDKNRAGITRGEIAYYCKMEKSTVSARVNEMLKENILTENGRRKDRFTNILSYTVIETEAEQRTLFI